MERERLRGDRPPYMLCLSSGGVGDRCDGVLVDARHRSMVSGAVSLPATLWCRTQGVECFGSGSARQCQCRSFRSA